jgi:succinoglycan biosynthesis transport protein ExoP
MSTTAGRTRKRGRGRSAPDAGLVVHTLDGALAHAMTPSTAESLRYFLARLEMNDEDGVPRRLGLTSALSGEGVTYIARSLATIIAHDFERSVCVVDLNWWDPQWQGFEPDDTGYASLVDLARQSAVVGDAVRPTSLPKLSLVSAGRIGRERRHIMAESSELVTAIDEIAAHFDHVVLDLPAVLKTSAALPQARLCDSFALVVRQGVTSQFQVASALDELRSLDSVGVILNATVTRTPKRLQRLFGF